MLLLLHVLSESDDNFGHVYKRYPSALQADDIVIT
jgi:hypothetical protein